MSPTNSIRRPLARAGIALLGAAALLAAVIYTGRLMRDSLRSDRRYQFPFNRIECPTPAGMGRDQFLSEVRYYGEMPESVSLLDEELRRQLTEAFAKHAWVEHVDAVEIKPDRRIEVELTFREPVLAVAYLDHERVVRLVDRNGILLPRAEIDRSVPRLADHAEPPKNGLGRPWGNPQVEEAARIAGLLRPHQGKLQISELRWKNGDLWLQCANGRLVTWGKPAAEESDAKRKIERLLEAIDRNPSKNGIDLRSD